MREVLEEAREERRIRPELVKHHKPGKKEQGFVTLTPCKIGLSLNPKNAIAHRFIFGNSFEITAVFAVAASAAKLLSFASLPDPLLLDILVEAAAKGPATAVDAAAGAMTGGCGAVGGGTLGVLTGSMGDPCRDRGCMNLSGFSGVGEPPPALASNLARPFATAPDVPRRRSCSDEFGYKMKIESTYLLVY